MSPIRVIDYENSTTDGKNCILLDRCWPCGVPTLFIVIVALSRPCDQRPSFPLASSRVIVFCVPSKFVTSLPYAVLLFALRILFKRTAFCVPSP